MNPVIYSVKEFNELINRVLTQEIGEVTLCGEISGYSVRQNKWVSFDLKDEGSCVNCFCSLYQLDFPLEDGQEVLITGSARIYVPYGKLSFNVTHAQIKGEGAIKKAFEALKLKLTDEGLFDPVHKRPIPRFPESVGIITSGEGAAINDILKVTNQRWGGLKIYLYPVLVQGKDAPDELVAALNYFNQRHPVDTIIFGRGGGSLEDLQAFNSERVARAIFSSKIPIVAGIGHEHNTCIADLVADVRAATPSNAAEIAIPDRLASAREIELLRKQALETVLRKITRYQHQLYTYTSSLHRHVTVRLGQVRLLIGQLHRHMESHTIIRQQYIKTMTQLRDQINEKWRVIHERSHQQIVEQKNLLIALSPHAIMERGYSITRSALTLKPITCLVDMPQDGRIVTQVRDGEFASVIENQTQPQIITNQGPATKRRIINETLNPTKIEQSSLF